MALRQFAVLVNAGSYVMSPKSSGPVRICRRSIARTVPSLIGSSYCFPVRLSVTVSVSGIAASARAIFAVVRIGRGVCRNAISALGPSRQVQHLAALAAERSPLRVHRPPATVNAERGIHGGGHGALFYLRRLLHKSSRRGGRKESRSGADRRATFVSASVTGRSRSPLGQRPHMAAVVALVDVQGEVSVDRRQQSTAQPAHRAVHP